VTTPSKWSLVVTLVNIVVANLTMPLPASLVSYVSGWPLFSFFTALESRVRYGIQIGERCSIKYLLRLFVAADLTQISTGANEICSGSARR